METPTGASGYPLRAPSARHVAPTATPRPVGPAAETTTPSREPSSRRGADRAIGVGVVIRLRVPPARPAATAARSRGHVARPRLAVCRPPPCRPLSRSYNIPQGRPAGAMIARHPFGPPPECAGPRRGARVPPTVAPYAPLAPARPARPLCVWCRRAGPSIRAWRQRSQGVLPGCWGALCPRTPRAIAAAPPERPCGPCARACPRGGPPIAGGADAACRAVTPRTAGHRGAGVRRSRGARRGGHRGVARGVGGLRRDRGSYRPVRAVHPFRHGFPAGAAREGAKLRPRTG